MPGGGGSQLKKLKASLKAAGVIGQPQLSKKAKKRQQSQRGGGTSRVDRETALESIRAEFNPFDLKNTKQKYDISGRGKIKGATGKPALSKQVGEENRKKTLLVEMKKRNRAGEIIDRRFGENDPTMAPEEKMLERFTRERQHRSRNTDIFNLEDDDVLTHYGQSLGGATKGPSMLDDFQENDLGGSSDDDEEFMTRRKEGRIIPLVANGDGDNRGEESDEDEEPARKKTKAEVMKEVMMKSKYHKYERQKQKDEDEDIREELDAELDTIRSLLATTAKPQAPAPALAAIGALEMNPERRRRMEGELNVDSQYDAAVREMTFDKRSKPADRTKTAEELAQEKAEQLQRLERKRLKRMRGDEDSSDEESTHEDENNNGEMDDEEHDEFGLGKGIGLAEEEREFIHGEDAASELGSSESDSDSESETENPFTNGTSMPKTNGINHSDLADGGDTDEPNLDFDFDDRSSESVAESSHSEESEEEEEDAPDTNEDDLTQETDATPSETSLAFTYPCPASHPEFLKILKDVKVEDAPVVVQRIRVLHHPSLHPDNKSKLENFVSVLLEHILWLSDNSTSIPFVVVETLIRHLHSLSKQFPKASANAFRDHIVKVNDEMSEPSSARRRSDMILFTAIGSTFPTSDLFHEVATPAMLLMCKYLTNNPPIDMTSLAKGTYFVTLCNKYQRLSKRVIPEAINFVSQALYVMAPEAADKKKAIKAPGSFPDHALSVESGNELCVPKNAKSVLDSLPFAVIFPSTTESARKPDATTLPTIAKTHFGLLDTLSKMHVGKSSFIELFSHFPALLAPFAHVPCLSALASEISSSLSERLSHSQRARRPLELHHHRPLAIPLNDPLFDEDYRPGKHMDKDPDRRELQKLKALHAKERKGAIRELRKDAAFIAREKLKERKEADREYHDKIRRLQATIQSEEGAAANEYEREQRRRKKKK